MNRQLIEDEGSRNPMREPELEERFGRFLDLGWKIVLFEHAGEVVGYAMHRFDPDETEPSGLRVYLRQFFIGREHRRRGLGRAAFEALVSLPDLRGKRVIVETLISNPEGRAFWGRLGFTTFAETLDWRP